jgi:aspartyl-tRNA(Asn)/glutamyl-tRNA(Gln) amidotransferase subunit A
MEEALHLSLAAAAERVRAKEMSPVALAEAALARIEVTEPVLNAYALITADLALDAARKAEGEIAAGHYRGPLHGIPVAVKDLYDMEGLPTRCSSEVRHDHVARADSACVERLKAAGAVIVGKTHTHEFAYGIMTPTTANPWNPERIPGGSSGGSGASVAARGCFMGLGSDTGGLDPNPGGALRHGRPQADLRSGQPGGRCLALLVARPTSSR